jgi:hypothetical protein
MDKSETDNQNLLDRVEDDYSAYAFRIEFTTMILIVLMNLVLVSLGLLGFVYLLD